MKWIKFIKDYPFEVNRPYLVYYEKYNSYYVGIWKGHHFEEEYDISCSMCEPDYFAEFPLKTN